VAVWQFNITLVPKRWFDTGGSVASLANDEGWETAQTWKGIDGSGLQERVEGILPRGKSWHPALTLWGSEEESDIQMFREHGFVESLGVRFDLRKPDMQLFRTISDLAQEYDLVIVDVARKRTIRDLNDLVRAAAESDAAHFVLDPASFLEQVGISARAT